MKSNYFSALTGLAFFIFSTASSAAIITYSSEATYLSALSSYSIISEGFESSDWSNTRPNIVGSSLTSQGLTWTASDDLTTGTGWANSGSYGVFDSYGNPDSISIFGTGTLFGVGGYFRGSSANSLLNYSVDNTLIGFTGIEYSHSFFGLIDTSGFNSITFDFQSGHFGADDFSVAMATATVPEPSVIALMGAGLVGFGFARRRARK